MGGWEIDEMEKTYAKREAEYKQGALPLKKSMQKVSGKGSQVEFKMFSTNLIAMYLCCRFMRANDTLRRYPKGRQVLFFNKGLEHLNKEMDLGYIIRHVRILRYFLKTVLESDQLALLKIKQKELIESSDQGVPSVYLAKKKVNKELLLDKYIYNL